MFGLLTRWLTDDGAGPPPPCAARLRCERLERRDNPADNFWMGYTTSFTDPANWSDGVPTPDDVLIFSGPTGGSTNPPLPPSGSHTSTTFVSLPPPIPYAPDTYAGIRIIEGYAGTLTIPFDIWFGGYEQSSGNTYTPGTDVTVTSTFSWTGGNLNTSNVAGEYRIAGVPLGVMNPNGNSVSTGSTIRMQANPAGIASVVDMLEGTYILRHGGGFVVQDGSLFRINAPAPKSTPTVIKIDDVRVYPDPDGQVKVKAGSYAEVYGGNSDVVFEASKPKMTNSGTVTMTREAKLTFRPTQGNGTDGGYWQQSEGAVTQVQAGCTFTCEQKTSVAILKGRLELTEKAGMNVAQPEITISAPNADEALTIGNDGVLTRSAGPTKPVQLTVKGYVYSIGTVELFLKRGVSENDKIVATKQVVLAQGSKLKLAWLDSGALQAVNNDWTLIESGYFGENPIKNQAQVTLPPVDDPDEVELQPLTIASQKLKLKRVN